MVMCAVQCQSIQKACNLYFFQEGNYFSFFWLNQLEKREKKRKELSVLILRNHSPDDTQDINQHFPNYNKWIFFF